MPVKHILEHVQKMRVIDIESIGGLLEHHGGSLEINNAFSSDCGDRWHCTISNGDGFVDSLAPSLRTAVLNAIEKFLHKQK